MTAAKNRGIGRERTPFEWTLLLVSVAAALTLADRARDLRCHRNERAGRPRDRHRGVADPASGGRPLEITVTNVGGTSAENVVVEVTVGDVSREVTLELVAKGDEESATDRRAGERVGNPTRRGPELLGPVARFLDDMRNARTSHVTHLA